MNTNAIVKTEYTELHSDIFSSQADAIVNTVNCVGVMGKGLALEFKKRYPEMFREYRKICARHELKPGQVWVYKAQNVLIFNCAVKDHWRNPSNIVWVKRCLARIVTLSREYNVHHLAVPLAGAMNGRIPVDQIIGATRSILSDVVGFKITVHEVRNIDGFPLVTKK